MLFVYLHFSASNGKNPFVRWFLCLKTGLSEEKINLMPWIRTFSNGLNALCSKAKQLRIFLRHGIRHDFLEIHLLLRV